MVPIRATLLTSLLALAFLPGALAAAESDRQAQTEATRAIASAFLQQLFAEQQSFAAYRRFASPDFKQHNPEMADGIAGREAFFNARAAHSGEQPQKLANVYNLLLVDGDLFAIHHHAFGSPGAGRVFVDIWRVAHGKIVEHWDVIQPYPSQSLNTNGMGCGLSGSYEAAMALESSPAHTTCAAPDSHVSRVASQKILEGYTRQIGSGDVRRAVERWFAADYRQHSPEIADGAAGAIAYLEGEFGKSPADRPRSIASRVLAEGDYVLYHRQVIYPGATRPSTNVDIFRVSHGKISEHWDVKQLQPESSANQNGMW